jgi:hypothetical protein
MRRAGSSERNVSRRVPHRYSDGGKIRHRLSPSHLPVVQRSRFVILGGATSFIRHAEAAAEASRAAGPRAPGDRDPSCVRMTIDAGWSTEPASPRHPEPAGEGSRSSGTREQGDRDFSFVRMTSEAARTLEDRSAPDPSIKRDEMRRAARRADSQRGRFPRRGSGMPRSVLVLSPSCPLPLTPSPWRDRPHLAARQIDEAQRVVVGVGDPERVAPE